MDGIRGLGALAVISAHYFHGTQGAGYSIEVFFALSGFLITTLLLEERDCMGSISLSAFYRRRAHRLLPALFTVLAAYAVFMSGSHVRALEQVAVGLFYATNIVMASGSHLMGISSQAPFWSALSPFWSLAQEEQFYLLWPLLLVLLLRRNIRESRIAVILACALIGLALYRLGLGLAGASWNRLYFGPDTHADGLVLGCLLGLLRRRGLRVPQWAGWLGLVPFFGLIAWNLPLPDAASEIAIGLTPLAIAATLIVGAALEPGLFSRCLSFRPVVWVGLISYSLYVWHMFVFWLFNWQDPLVALPVTLAIGTFSYYKIEKPLRNAYRNRRPALVAAEPGPVVEVQPAAAHP
jgi:peptidoglycan/LPS O-acetylase OafA/YrhL